MQISKELTAACINLEIRAAELLTKEGFRGEALCEAQFHIVLEVVARIQSVDFDALCEAISVASEFGVPPASLEDCCKVCFTK